jgi:hypothetical protein
MPGPVIETAVQLEVVETPVVEVPQVTETIAPEPEPWHAKLKLEGIMYHPKQPSVQVNGKSIFVGERVNGITLVAVEIDNATFEFDGQRKTLLIQ